MQAVNKNGHRQYLSYADKLMQYVCNNQEQIFKKDIRLFHQGFPPQFESLDLRNDSDNINIVIEKQNNFDDQIDKIMPIMKMDQEELDENLTLILNDL